MKIALIAAMDLNRLIGANGRMPWHLPADLRHFRRVTWGKPIIMGRRTHEAIGSALPGRVNIVVTRNPDYKAPGCVVVHNLSAALLASGAADQTFIIGGAEIYAACLPLAERIYLTELQAEFTGDAYFPALAANEWRETNRITVADDPTVDFSYRFLMLERYGSQTG